MQQVVIPASFEQIATIIDEMPRRLELFIVLAAFVGLREGELMELHRSDVDGLTGRISVTRKVDKDADPSVRGACPECDRFISTPKARSGILVVHVPPPFLPMPQGHLLLHAALGPRGLLFPGDRTDHMSARTSSTASTRLARRPDGLTSRSTTCATRH